MATRSDSPAAKTESQVVGTGSTTRSASYYGSAATTVAAATA